jgi:hypothetical protein
VLDEATSSLDSESEALIQDASQGDAERTSIVIAHRLSNSGRRLILVMDGARSSSAATMQIVGQKRIVCGSLQHQFASPRCKSCSAVTGHHRIGTVQAIFGPIAWAGQQSISQLCNGLLERGANDWSKRQPFSSWSGPRRHWHSSHPHAQGLAKCDQRKIG